MATRTDLGTATYINPEFTIPAGSEGVFLVIYDNQFETVVGPGAPTINGVAMTPVGTEQISWWVTLRAYFLADPATGVQTIGHTGGNYTTAWAMVSYEGIDDASPFSGVNSRIDDGTTPAAIPVTSDTGNEVLFACYDGDPTARDPTDDLVGGELLDFAITDAGRAFLGVAPGASTVTGGWATAGGANRVIIGFSVNDGAPSAPPSSATRTTYYNDLIP